MVTAIVISKSSVEMLSVEKTGLNLVVAATLALMC